MARYFSLCLNPIIWANTLPQGPSVQQRSHRYMASCSPTTSSPSRGKSISLQNYLPPPRKKSIFPTATYSHHKIFDFLYKIVLSLTKTLMRSINFDLQIVNFNFLSSFKTKVSFVGNPVFVSWRKLLNTWFIICRENFNNVLET